MEDAQAVPSLSKDGLDVPASKATDQYYHLAGLPRRQWYEAEQQGTIVKVRRKTDPPELPDNPPRGQVLRFSSASRLNLLDRIARIDWNVVGKNQFLTLTYPDPKWFKQCRAVNQDMWIFVRYFEEKLARKFAWLWRIEWKPRLKGKHKGRWAPHLHLLPFGLGWVHWATVRAVWKRVLQWTDYVHTYCKLKSGEAAARYAAKYAAKEEDLGSLVDNAYLERAPGRVWGIARPNLVPWAAAQESGPLDQPSERAAKNIGHRRSSAYKEGGFRLFASNAATVFNAILAADENSVDVKSRDE
jgi:hypothetical protein